MACRGLKAWQAFNAKAAEYDAHMNKLLLFRNLASNGGVISSLMDEAQEQVCKGGSKVELHCMSGRQE
jgi:hypothetical protein